MASQPADDDAVLDEPPADPSDLRSQPISPVSPKPIYYPAPSNIPILEQQLDQNYVLPDQGFASPPQSHSANGATSQPLQPAQISSLDAIVNAAAAAAAAANNQSNGVTGGTPRPEAHPKDPSPQATLPDPQAQATDQLSHMSVSSSTPFAPGGAQGVDDEALENSAEDRSATLNGGPQASHTTDNVHLEQNAVSSVDVQLQALFDKIAAQTAAGQPLALDELDFDGQNELAAEKPDTAQKQQGAEMDAKSGQDGSSQQFSAQDFARINERFGLSPESSLQLSSQFRPPNSAAAPNARQTQHTSAGQNPGKQAGEGRKEDDERPWGPEIQKIYDKFLEDERKYVADGKWETFPSGSRLFVGNLPSERVTKRDIFHVFHRYGKLAQISIKQAYGFVQFLERESCQRAHDAEQGVTIRGKKVNLEISKPQRKAAQGQGREKERDKERDRERERERERERGRNRRSPSPRGGNGQRVDSYRGVGRRRSISPRHRGRDRTPEGYYDGRHRSRSPFARRRSPEARREDTDDDLPLPRRAPRDVPDIQIIVKDKVDQPFLHYLEHEFKVRGVTASTLVLNPRLHEPAVFRRQILEGVLAVMTVDRIARATSRYKMTLFEYSGNSVNYNEYADLDLGSCIGLLQQARHKAGKTSTPYGLPVAAPEFPPVTSFGYPPPGVGASAGGIAQAGGYSGPSPPPRIGPGAVPGQPPQPTPDLNAILATIGQHGRPPQAPGVFANTAANQPGHSRQSSWGVNPAGSYGVQSPPQSMPPFPQSLGFTPSPQGAPPPDMDAIMAQLSQYKAPR